MRRPRSDVGGKGQKDDVETEDTEQTPVGQEEEELVSSHGGALTLFPT